MEPVADIIIKYLEENRDYHLLSTDYSDRIGRLDDMIWLYLDEIGTLDTICLRSENVCRNIVTHPYSKAEIARMIKSSYLKSYGRVLMSNRYGLLEYRLSRVETIPIGNISITQR